MPASAARIRRVPSNRNGLVTTPTVSTPLLRAASAITGAAPVPVPPPMPAAMKHMFTPSSRSSISLRGFFRCGLADFRTRSCAQTAGNFRPELNPRLCGGIVERLSIGVRDDEFDTFDPVFDHVADCVSARAADTDDGDFGAQLVAGRGADIDTHFNFTPHAAGMVCRWIYSVSQRMAQSALFVPIFSTELTTGLRQLRRRTKHLKILFRSGQNTLEEA